MYTLKPLKIAIKNEAHNLLVQNELKRIGYSFFMNFQNENHLYLKSKYLILHENGRITKTNYDYIFDCQGFEVTTLEKLKKTKSILEVITEQLKGLEIEIKGDKNSLALSFNGKLEIELKDFWIDIHIDCYQNLTKEKGESNVGISDGMYVDSSNEVEVLKMDYIVYDKESSEIYFFASSDIWKGIENELIKRLTIKY